MKDIWNKLDIPQNPHKGWEIELLNFRLRAILENK